MSEYTLPGSHSHNPPNGNPLLSVGPLRAGEIMHLTALALESSTDRALIDRITITRAYAELSVMYPEILDYRYQVIASLVKLAEAVDLQGNPKLAESIRSIVSAIQYT